MVLSSQTSYPHALTYVLKLHRDAAPQEGRFLGRIEHLVTGQQFSFATGEELLACLARAALATTPDNEAGS